MADRATLDQLRTLALVAELGSFSAAARKLRRVQSAVSASMANLESQLGVTLWDRTTKLPKLTDAGKAILAVSQRVLEQADALNQLATLLESGVEARVSLSVDALFPQDVLVSAFAEFARLFPTVQLRVDVQALAVVGKRVEDGRATMGLVGPHGLGFKLEHKLLSNIRMIPCVSPSHPLAAFEGPIPTKEFADQVQIVLTERRDEEDEGVPDQAVLSPRTWRVTELSVKHQLLRAGLGWGNLPEPLARKDLASGRLVAIQPAAWSPDEFMLPFSVVYKKGMKFGPAHRWLFEKIGALCQEAPEAASPEPPLEARRKKPVRRAAR